MNADPLWQAIKKRLERQIDPALFERCMQDLLRADYPNLAPVVGGSDNGMDGAFGSPEGPFPLICTTSDNVVGNFKKSIAKHLDARRRPKRCVLATSQHLTPQRRSNILDAASEIGVTVINIHDQEDVIGRLYRNSEWRLELLGLSGNPPALSRFPQRIRNAEASLLIGREDDLAWLRSTKGDLLIVGEPGSGKTHIHRHMASNGKALFLVSDNATDVANAVRDQSPSIIVVDDAHVNLAKIDLLRRLRHEIGATYSIHANSWPNEHEHVRARLDISEGKIRHLDLLTQKQIRELIEKLGIIGPDSVLYIIIEQSEGRPGLTSALVEACNRGRLDQVWSGEALADSLLVDRRIVHDEIDKAILAAFSLGGDPGLPTDAVAQQLGIPLIELRKRLSSLGTGGIVSETYEQRVTVRPAALRAVLVRDVFFKGLARLNFLNFSPMTRDGQGTIHVLLNARQRGADISLDYLEEQVSRQNSKDLWEHFAWVDEDCGRRILELHPNEIVHAATGLLHFIPEATINGLLDSASLKAEGNANKSYEALGKIANWACPMDDFSLVGARRKQFIGILERRSVGVAKLNPRVIAGCIKIVAEPGYSSHTAPPGAPMTVQIRRGVIPLICLTEIMAEWPALVSLASRVPSTDWLRLIDMLRDWLWPSNHMINQPLPSEIYDYMREAGRRMLVDLASLPECKGIARCELSALAKAAKLDIRIKSKGLARIFFRDPDLAVDYKTRQARRERELQLHAAKLLPRGARAVTSELAVIEKEAVAFGKTSGGWDRWLLYYELARTCDDAAEWLNEAVISELPPDAVWRFLWAVAAKQPERLNAFLRELIKSRTYGNIAVDLILRTPEITEDLLQNASEKFLESESADSFYLVNERTTSRALKMLLNHPNKAILSAAALGIWQRSSGTGPPAEFKAEWRAAIVALGNNEHESHWLDQIFEKFPDIAKDWAMSKLRDWDRWLWKDQRGMRAATKVLPLAERSEMLAALMSHPRFDEDCFDAIVAMMLNFSANGCETARTTACDLHRCTARQVRGGNHWQSLR